MPTIDISTETAIEKCAEFKLAKKGGTKAGILFYFALQIHHVKELDIYAWHFS